MLFKKQNKKTLETKKYDKNEAKLINQEGSVHILESSF